MVPCLASLFIISISILIMIVVVAIVILIITTLIAVIAPDVAIAKKHFIRAGNRKFTRKQSASGGRVLRRVCKGNWNLLALSSSSPTSVSSTISCGVLSFLTFDQCKSGHFRFMITYYHQSMLVFVLLTLILATAGYFGWKYDLNHMDEDKDWDDEIHIVLMCK